MTVGDADRGHAARSKKPAIIQAMSKSTARTRAPARANPNAIPPAISAASATNAVAANNANWRGVKVLIHRERLVEQEVSPKLTLGSGLKFYAAYEASRC